MSSNKKAKEELIKYYGEECFIEKLHLRKDTEPRQYTGKAQYERMKQLTYHHIKMKKDGGEATRENGAILSFENHIWFNKQSESAQGYMNAIFQEYKRQVDECRVVFTDDLNFDFKVIPMEFKPKDLEKKKCNDNKKYDRAKEMEDFKKTQKDLEDR